MIFKLLLAAILIASLFASGVADAVSCDAETQSTSSDFDCTGKEGPNPFPGDCTRFILCSKGVAFCMNCTAPLEFNPTLEVCDLPQNAGCSVNSATTAAPVVTTASPTAPPTTTPPTTTEYPYKEEY